MELTELCKSAKEVSRQIGNLDTNTKNEVLRAAAEAIVAHTEEIIRENEKDLARGRENHMPEGLLDRLMLNPSRMEQMAEGVRQVADLADPIGEVLSMKKRPNGLMIGKKRVPLGVVGIIGSIIAVRYICRINLKKEEEELNTQEADMKHMPHMLHLEVRNEAIDGKKLIQVKDFLGRSFVCSRIRHEGHVSIPNQDTEFHIGDQLFIVCSEEDAEAVTAFIGREIQVDWEKQDTPMVSRRILVTKSEINGKKLGSMHFRSMYGVNVTRINRSGMDLFADPNLVLQVGDRVMVVGQQDAVERVAGVLGNQLKRLDTPNIVTIFVGIFLGILLGSLPIAFPGMPTPVKLGLAGGPLVVAILIGRFGHKMHLVTYTTMSANLMLREIGIVLFLASVGIEAGEHFVQTVVEGSGLAYVGYGFLITTIPLLIIGMIARFYCKVNYFTLMGLIAGSNTDPPALAYSNQASGNDAPSVGYSTVYPLTMFLRILAGQMILLAMM